MPGMLIDTRRFVPEAIAGFCDLYGHYVQPVAGGVVRSRSTRPVKVAVVIGGGSGHYPAFMGYVGPGLADGAVIGNIFASPSTRQVRDVARAAERGAGVLLTFGNYTGDVLNFELAAARLRSEGVETEVVTVTDDIASAPGERRPMRRGIAGDTVVFKIAGAAAERAMSLPDVAAVARAANEATRSFGVAFRGCTIPGSSSPLFSLPENALGVGIGIHGEPGIGEQPLCSGAELAALLVDRLLAEAPSGANARPIAILNGLGATKSEELFYLWHHIQRRLRSAGVEPATSDAGEFVTSFDMSGCSLTLAWLDRSLLSLWSDPVQTPALQRGAPIETQPVGPLHLAPPPPLRVGSGRPEERHRVATLVRVLAEVVRELDAAETELNLLDAVAGDGDHGRSVLAGSRAALAAAELGFAASMDFDAALESAADAWCDASGGTSGALWAAGLRAVAAAARTFDGTQTDLSVVARAALDAVTRLGGAQPGDKTIVDALAAFTAAAGAGIDAAVEAADRAARNTAGLSPKLGRARPLAARSVGHADPGAISFALCAEASRRALYAKDFHGG